MGLETSLAGDTTPRLLGGGWNPDQNLPTLYVCRVFVGACEYVFAYLL